MTLERLRLILDVLVTKLPANTPLCAAHDELHLAPDTTLEDLRLDAAEASILATEGPVLEGRDGLFVFT